MNKVAIVLLLAAIGAAHANNPVQTLEFGLFLQNTSRLSMYDLFSQCLSSSIDNFQVVVPVNQPFVPGNYLWADIDSTLSAAHQAGLDNGREATICLQVGIVQVPMWCWTYYYGQLGVSDYHDLSIYQNLDVYNETHRQLALRYGFNGTYAQREGWNGWEISRYNTFGESDLHWHPCGFDTLVSPVHFYKIRPAEMRLPQLAAAYKDVRQVVQSVDPSAQIAISFMCQPYAEGWPATDWVTGIGQGEFTPFMELFYDQFSTSQGYHRYPDIVDWHCYPVWNDPLKFGGDEFWISAAVPPNLWARDIVLSQRGIAHDAILDDYGFDECELRIHESGATPFWGQIRPQYRTGENAVRGHCTMLLTMLAEMAANDRTTLLQFDTDLDEVTSDPTYLPEGYSIRNWWNDIVEPEDEVFTAYSRMAELLAGKYFTDRVAYFCLATLDRNVIVHTFTDPETGLNVYQLRTEFPTAFGTATYQVRIPVATRYVNIIPSIGTPVINHDCGTLLPHMLVLDVDWQVQWVEEVAGAQYLGYDNGVCLSNLSGNPVTNGHIRLALTANSLQTDSEITVYDVTGRIVAEVPFTFNRDGSAEVNISTDGIPSGIYYVCPSGQLESLVSVAIL